MAANTPVDVDDIVLEVAAGTALFGRAIAPLVRAVIAIDITPEMLSEGKRVADASGRSNLLFQIGDATRLPFLDASFDAVISRLAVHHFDDPDAALSEMVRVCRPGGTVTVIDMVVVDESNADRFNDLERRRDQAHTRALTRTGLRDAVERAGLHVTHTSSWENVLDGERWMEQTSTSADDAAVIRAAWDEELSGGAATGMAPRRRDGHIEFVHVWDLIGAQRLMPR